VRTAVHPTDRRGARVVNELFESALIARARAIRDLGIQSVGRFYVRYKSQKRKMPYCRGQGREAGTTALLPVDGAFKLFPSFGAIRSAQAETRWLRDATLKSSGVGRVGRGGQRRRRRRRLFFRGDRAQVNSDIRPRDDNKAATYRREIKACTCARGHSPCGRRRTSGVHLASPG